MRPTDDVFDWATDTNDGQGNPTKADPPLENKTTGLTVGQPWPRLWHNYAFNNIAAYLKHLANDPVGTVKITTQGAIPNTTAEWGGTWSTVADTIGATNIPVDIHTKTGV